ncbi:hypothetical protein AB9K17_24160, partial [Salmonella enterica subsp. enterica serovar Kentucky]|uniref:hypothetical protein n=1 Tax=Salmonella enterica TaxID=28901 RepID=UPI003F4BBECD
AAQFMRNTRLNIARVPLWLNTIVAQGSENASSQRFSVAYSRHLNKLLYRCLYSLRDINR